MTFTQSMSTCFRKYFDGKGRAFRSEFWWFFVFTRFWYFITGIMAYVYIETSGNIISVTFLAMLIVAIASIPPYLYVFVRRLHDINTSGWWVLVPIFIDVLIFTEDTFIHDIYIAVLFGRWEWILGVLGLILYIRAFFLLVHCCFRGTPEANKYGEPPSKNG